MDFRTVILLIYSLLYGVVQSQLFRYSVHLVNLMIDTVDPKHDIEFLYEGLRLILIIFTFSMVSLSYWVLHSKCNRRKEEIMMRIFQNFGSYTGAVFITCFYYNWKITLASCVSSPITIILSIILKKIEGSQEISAIVLNVIRLCSQNIFNGLAIYISVKEWRLGHSTPSEIFLTLTSLFWVNSRIEDLTSDIYTTFVKRDPRVLRSFSLSFPQKTIYTMIRFLSVSEFFLLWYLWTQLLSLFEDKSLVLAVIHRKLQNTLSALAAYTANQSLSLALPCLFFLCCRKDIEEDHLENTKFIEENNGQCHIDGLTSRKYGRQEEERVVVDIIDKQKNDEKENIKVSQKLSDCIVSPRLLLSIALSVQLILPFYVTWQITVFFVCSYLLYITILRCTTQTSWYLPVILHSFPDFTESVAFALAIVLYYTGQSHPMAYFVFIVCPLPRPSLLHFDHIHVTTCLISTK